MCIFRLCRAVTKQVAAAKTQIFQQGPLFRLIQAGKGAPKRRREHRPLPPVLQGRRKLLRLWPRGLVFLWGIGKKFQAWAFTQVKQQPGEQRLRRGCVIFSPTGGGICPTAQQQPQAALAPLRYASCNAPPARILAQTHDGGRGRTPHTDALGSDKAERILAPKAQAELSFAPAAVDHEGQKAIGGFLNFFHPCSYKQGDQVFTAAAKKMGIHRKNPACGMWWEMGVTAKAIQPG